MTGGSDSDSWETKVMFVARIYFLIPLSLVVDFAIAFVR